MANGSDIGKDKTDWSDVDAHLRSRRFPEEGHEESDRQVEGALVPTENAHIPMALSVPRPDFNALVNNAEGTIMKWRAGRLQRQAALECLSENYQHELEKAKYYYKKMVEKGKKEIDVGMQEYFDTLDAKHVEILAQIGVGNAANRWKAVVHLTQEAVTQVKEVRREDWPKEMIDDTIDKIWAIRERVAGRIMRELGSEQSKS